VWESLTPYALYRTAFLREHGIPDALGDGPLDREMATIRALLAAKFVAILADGICSYDVPRPGERIDGDTGPQAHASRAWLDPARYYLELRKLVAYVQRHTEPGDLRNTALNRIYRSLVLRELREPYLLTWSQQVRDPLFTQACALASDELFDPVHTSLPLLERIGSDLIRRGRLDDLMELSRRTATITATARLHRAEWKHGRLEITLSGELVRAEGGTSAPIDLIRHSGHDYLDPELLRGLGVEVDPEVTKELRRYRAEVVVQHRETGARWTVPAGLELVIEHVGADDRGTRCRLSFRVTAGMDPDRL